MSENWKEILKNNKIPEIDLEKKRKTIETIKLEIATTEIIGKENYIQKVKRYLPFINKSTLFIQ